MPTKADFEKTIKELQKQLETEQARTPRHTISDCHINMANPDETKIAIATAVKEGMKALQSLGGNNYGIYLSND